MNKGHKRKLLFLSIAIATLIFYARTVPQVSLNERAIVIGLGIDYSGGKYIVSTQIINPSSASQTGSSNDSYGVLTGEGATLTEAIVQIAQYTGLNVSLSQCNVVILGNGVPYGSEFPSVNFLVQNYQIPEQALLLATDSSAVDLLRATPVLTTTSSFQLQQTFTATEDSAEIMHTNVKNFIAGYLSESGVAPIAYVVAEEVSEEDSGGTEATSPSSQKNYIFNYDKTLLLSSSQTSLLLEKEDTMSINLLSRTLDSGALDVEVNGAVFSLQLTKGKNKDKAKLSNGRLNFSVSVKLDFNVAEVTNIEEYGSLDDVTDEHLEILNQKVKEILEAQIASTYLKCKEGGYDVYKIYNKAYSAEGVKWKELAGNGNYLDLVDFRVEVDAEVIRK